MTRATARGLAAAAATGALLGLFARAEAPWHLLGFVAFVPWLLAGPAPGALALAEGALASLAMTAVGFAWLPAAIAGYARGSGAIAWVVVVAVAPLVLQPQLLAWGLAVGGARRRGAGLLVAGALGAGVYVGAETYLPRLFGDTLGYGLYPAATLRQAADLAGARGLTLVLLVVNAAVAAALVRPRRALVPAAVAVLLLGGASGYGLLRERQVGERLAGAPAITAGVVQANITKYDKLAAESGTYEAVRAILDAHFARSRQLLERAPLDLLVWPETVYPTSFGTPRTPESAAMDKQIGAMVARTGVPLVFGAFERDGDAEYNAAFFIAPDGAGRVAFDTYRKSLLFPMTERVPPWLDSAWLRRELPWTGRWTPGPGPQVLPLALRGARPPLRAVPLICYEVLDADYVARAAGRGADLIVTLSNDAWFPDAAAPRLHLLIAAFRSIETRLPQVRATNSGMSAIILPTGELRAATGFGVAATFAEALPVAPPERTLVVAWGDWIAAPALLAAALGLALVSLRRRAPRADARRADAPRRRGNLAPPRK